METKLQGIKFQFQYLLQTPCNAAITSLSCKVLLQLHLQILTEIRAASCYAQHKYPGITIFLQDLPVQLSNRRDKKKIGLHNAAQQQYWILKQQSPGTQLQAVLLDHSKPKIWPRFAQTNRPHSLLCYYSEILVTGESYERKMVSWGPFQTEFSCDHRIKVYLGLFVARLWGKNKTEHICYLFCSRQRGRRIISLKWLGCGMAVKLLFDICNTEWNFSHICIYH